MPRLKINLIKKLSTRRLYDSTGNKFITLYTNEQEKAQSLQFTMKKKLYPIDLYYYLILFMHG